MYAIFSNGGKQYQAKIGQTIRLEKINLNQGKQIKFHNILMIVDNNNIQIGKPKILNSFVLGDIIQHGKNKKIKIIKFNRRKHYKKTQGHRQNFTDIKIISIQHSTT
ncbi:50S ribosomal protein L21 [Buchnera aphidicola]|uniref:50S ribosomal protein L21 n=1 Tax=Buchnera aphidicola TaxID=9 RepID=UPI00346466F7